MAEPFAQVQQLLDKAVAEGTIPGAQALVGDADIVWWQGLAGVRRYGGEAVSADTRYDLASLTKVVATLPAVLRLAADGELDLDAPLEHTFSNAGWFQEPSVAQASAREFLTHTSGLPAWKPFFSLVSERRTALANALQTPLEYPSGRMVYSDIGFILLGALVERLGGQRQDRFVQDRLFEPLGMNATGYGPIENVPIAATEDCGWRGWLLEGVVHDENAFVMDGVAGHAGLFGTAHDLARYAQAWLRRDLLLGSPELLEAATSEQVSEGGVRRGLGWQLAAAESSAGRHAGPRAFGHTGFTGTSLWLDPDAGRFAVLLSNRVHPHRSRGEGIHELRVAFHDAVAEASA